MVKKRNKQYFCFSALKYSTSTITKLSSFFFYENEAKSNRFHERAKGKILIRQIYTYIYIHAFRAEKYQNICNSFLEQAFQYHPYSSYIKMKMEKNEQHLKHKAQTIFH